MKYYIKKLSSLMQNYLNQKYNYNTIVFLITSVKVFERPLVSEEWAFGCQRQNYKKGKGRCKMKKLTLILIFILIYCGSGPAEDRAERNCKNSQLSTLAIINNENISIRTKQYWIFLANINCQNQEHDSLINRYYRGYVLDKE
jgi:hypothetical protein